MDWLKPSFFALSLLFVLLGPSHCRVGDDSKFAGVRRYEECVLSRLSRSRFFKEHDRDRMLKAVEKSNLEHHDSDKKVSAALKSFVITATNMVAGSNTPSLVDAYITVTETCSLSLPQHLAEEVMQEVQKILCDETEETVLSRRRVMPTTAPDVKTRRKRSPQAVTFGSFWQPSESLQTVLSNILLNSNPFQNVFSGRASRRDAIFYARSMVESGLSDYHFSVVQDAVSSVVNAISNFPFQPEANDYAIAIANGVTSVLDARELSLFADGAGIGNAMVSRLQAMLNNRNPTSSFQSSFGSGAASSFAWSSSGSQQRQAPNQRQGPNFQMNPGFLPNLPMNPGIVMNPPTNPGFMMNPPMNPGFIMNPPMNNPPSDPRSMANPPMNPTFFDGPQTDPSEEFQSDLAFYLYQSDQMQAAFCNGPFPGAYDMVNEGLSEYGLPVSVMAASSATDSLSAMNPSDVCVEFGNVIAESVTNALRDNDLLGSADAQTIADSMASSMGQPPPPSEPQDGSPVFYEFPPSDPNPPQYPDYGMPPFVPMDEMQPQGAPETLQPPPQSSDSAEMPPQETKSQVEYPLLDPSFAPSDYSVDTATMTGTNIPTGQESSSDVSMTRDQQSSDVSMTGDQQSFSDVSMTRDQQSSSDISMTRDQQSSSDVSMTGDQQPETPDEPQPKPNNQDEAPQRDEMTTTQAKPTENMPTTILDVIMATATTPYPEAVTTPSKKAMDSILKDIFTALRSLNSTSEDSGSDKEGAVTTLSPPATAPAMEKADSSVAKPNTPDSPSANPPETPVAVELQPSFMSTPPPRDSTTPEDDDDSDLRDPTVTFVHHVSDIASAGISMIRSGSVSLPELCEKLNPLASVVDIPPLDVCGEVALVDFLLNVIKAVTLILRGV